MTEAVRGVADSPIRIDDSPTALVTGAKHDFHLIAHELSASSESPRRGEKVSL